MRKPNRLIALMRTLSVSTLLMSTAFAAPGAVASKEIDHLLTFIGNAKCTFIRNGSDYTSAEGKDHIAMKYNKIKDKVTTTEDFIRYAATESSMSGKAYKVRCAGTPELTSADWLKAELAKFRAQSKTGG